MSDLVHRDIKNMLVHIRWKYIDQDIEHDCNKIFSFVTLDCIDRKVLDIIYADSCFQDIEYAYWFNGSGIKTYVYRKRDK